MLKKKSAAIKKVLILGAAGMLAADLIKTFQKSKKYKVVGWTRKDLDITASGAVVEKITKLKPDIIINATAYNEVDKAEKEFDLALQVNGYALRHIADAALKIGATLVHYSTDYVFDGKNPNGYKEGDETDPACSYGQSKFAGEQMILMTLFHNSGKGCSGCGAGQGCGKAKVMKPLKYYIIRTSWLFGHNGKNFAEAMLAAAQKSPELKVVNDQHGSPTYTVDLAQTTKYLIEKNLPYNIYHFTNKTPKRGITWYDFAKEIFKIRKIKVAVKPVSTTVFYKGNENYLANRPEYSMLVDTKKLGARDWKEALGDYLKEK